MAQHFMHKASRDISHTSTPREQVKRTRRLARVLAGVMCLCGILQLAPALAVELPSESLLPGEKPTQLEVTPPPSNPPSNLPPESLLPGESQEFDPRVEDPLLTDPPVTDPNLNTPPPQAEQLPGETLLPPDHAIRAEPPATDTQLVQGRGPEPPPADAPAQIGARPQGQPWLRFNIAGHTAPVRAMTFVPGTDLLCSAGEDKVVEVWSPAAAANGKWVQARTIRWQVQRGARGRVYALAASQDSLAMAGHGAMGMLGEIILVDPATGAFQRALTDEKGHRQVIASLSFSPSGNQLAAVDVAGQSSLWTRNVETGQWSYSDLTPPDVDRYGAATAKLLTPWRRTAPVIVAGEKVVVQPVFEKQQLVNRPNANPQAHMLWQLESIDLKTRKATRLVAGKPHYGMVTAMAVSADSHLLASADAYGQLVVWDLTLGRAIAREQLDAVAVSLAFAPDGKQLLVGSARSPKLDNRAQVQIYDLTDPAQPQVSYTKQQTTDVYAAVAKAGGQQFAYSQDAEIKVASWNQPATESTIAAAAIRPIHRVAFALNKPYYRVAIGTTRDAAGDTPLEMTYDLNMLQLGRDAQLNDADWLRGRTWKRDWEIKPIGPGEYQLTAADRVQCTIKLRPEFHGAITSASWIPGRTGKPGAVAVGTSSRGDIYVYQLAAQGEAPLLRHFRGHGGAVTSLCVSRDLKYLASSSTDATVCVWPLAGYNQDDRLLNNWGVELNADAGPVTVSEIRADGPLYHRGVRQGDSITAVTWHNGIRETTAIEADEIIEALKRTEPDQLVAFDTTRGRQAQQAFQIYPAWNPLSQLAIARDREWAYWTPAGYYDASFDGHKMFGWQINKGLANPPEFFLAAQFREALEKPEVMQNLLEAGSLEAALKLAQEAPAVEGAEAVISQLRSAPKIEITGPTEGGNVSGGVATVTADISLRRGVQLARVKAFANGVVAGEGKQIAAESIPGGTKYTYEFAARLPSEKQIALDVIAATDAETVDFARVMVNQPEIASRAGKGRMFVFTSGINSYRDGQIPPLDFAVNNARKVAEILEQQAGSLYNAEAITLTDASVTRSLWKIVAEEYADSLRTRVSPDDVLVLFLSGHGLRDQATNGYYYVGADADYAEIQSQQFGGCISQEDFAVFADIPCRKLVILDTCHSGAVHNDLQNPELKQRDLKAAIRALQDDMMLTITASEGHELAFEEKTREHGLFTSRLLEALAGAADQTNFGGDANGQVSLPETISYVQTMVETDSAAEGLMQHPTAGPHDLLPLVKLPLTAARGE